MGRILAYALLVAAIFAFTCTVLLLVARGDITP